jgi:hypothetical protein
MRREELEGTLSPAGLRDPGRLLGNQVRDALGVARELGLVRADGEALSLDAEVDPVRVGTPEALATHAFRSVLASQDADLLHVLSWFLDEDPYRESISWSVAGSRLLSAYGEERFGLNDARYLLAMYWAMFLGLARRVDASAFVPDPTSAVRRLVRDLLQRGERTPMVVFREGLAKHAPIFEGGRWRLSVRAARVAPIPSVDFGLSTSLALLRLHEKEEIKMEMRPDGEPVSLVDAGGQTSTRSVIERLV